MLESRTASEHDVPSRIAEWTPDSGAFSRKNAYLLHSDLAGKWNCGKSVPLRLMKG